MRSVPVNGYFYALDRQTGNVRWNNEVLHQQVVLEHFQEMPVVMFTARPFQEMGRGVRNFNMQMTSFRSIDKRTGKLLLDEPDISQNVMFHALNMDLRAGKIELIGHQVRVVHFLPNYDAAAAKDAKPATQPNGRPSSTAPGRRLGVKVAPAVPVPVIEKKP